MPNDLHALFFLFALLENDEKNIPNEKKPPNTRLKKKTEKKLTEFVVRGLMIFIWLDSVFSISFIRLSLFILVLPIQ